MLASIEHTLTQGRAPLPQMRGPTFSPSSFVEAVDPNATLVPEASRLAATIKPSDGLMMLGSPASVTTANLGPTTPSSRRGTWLVIGALLVVGVIAVSIVLASRRRDPIAAAPVAKPTDRAVDAMIPTPAPDAELVVIADAAIPVDAGVQISQSGALGDEGGCRTSARTAQCACAPVTRGRVDRVGRPRPRLQVLT